MVTCPLWGRLIYESEVEYTVYGLASDRRGIWNGKEVGSCKREDRYFLLNFIRYYGWLERIPHGRRQPSHVRLPFTRRHGHDV